MKVKREDPLNWVKERCDRWANKVWAVFIAKGGWPATAPLGKLIEEGVTGAGSTRFVQHYKEVLIGENLETHNVVKMLPEDDREYVFLQYIVRGPAKMKYHTLGISKSTYYSRLQRAHENFSTKFSMLGQFSSNSPGQTPPQSYTFQIS